MISSHKIGDRRNMTKGMIMIVIVIVIVGMSIYRIVFRYPFPIVYKSRDLKMFVSIS